MGSELRKKRRNEERLPRGACRLLQQAVNSATPHVTRRLRPTATGNHGGRSRPAGNRWPERGWRKPSSSRPLAIAIRARRATKSMGRREGVVVEAAWRLPWQAWRWQRRRLRISTSLESRPAKISRSLPWSLSCGVATRQSASITRRQRSGTSRQACTQGLPAGRRHTQVAIRNSGMFGSVARTAIGGT